jgi:hypothetical protein
MNFLFRNRFNFMEAFTILTMSTFFAQDAPIKAVIALVVGSLISGAGSAYLDWKAGKL